MTEATEDAYDAGLIDADGCITVTRTKGRARATDGQRVTSWGIVIAMHVTDEFTIKRLHARYGGYIYAKSIERLNRTGNPVPFKRPIHVWHITAIKAQQVLLRV